MKKYVAAIDQGTTSTRCIIFDKQGDIVSSGQKEHAQIYPRPGWVEHNPDEIWQNTLEVIAQALAVRSIAPDDIAAVGITNQRETTVVWNRKSGRAYHNAIVWQDTRTADLVQHFKSIEESDWWRVTTGLPLATYFSALKLLWLFENVPGLRTDAERGDVYFGNMDTYLIWRLTGGPKGGLHITDVTNASRTQMMNIFQVQWDEEAMRRLNLPENVLPEIVPSSKVYGVVAEDVLKGVPIAGDLGDQQAALLGQTCLRPGEAKNTYGTGCFMLMNTGTKVIPSQAGLLTTIAYQFHRQPVHYALEGSVAVAGSLVQWLRDNLGLIRSSDEIEALARSVDDNGGVYFVPAFSGLFAPYWRSEARGVVAGLTAYANKAHLARAVLEATAFQTKEMLEAMERDSGIRLSSLRVDGGMVVNELLMQFQADILGVPVIRPRVIETTALGAAYAAGLAVDYWTNFDDLRRNWAVEKTWEPDMDERDRAERYMYWQKAVERTFEWLE